MKFLWKNGAIAPVLHKPDRTALANARDIGAGYVKAEDPAGQVLIDAVNAILDKECQSTASETHSE